MHEIHNEGYIILKDVFPESVLKEVRKVSDNIFFQQDTENNKNVFSQYFLRDRKDQGVMYDVFFRYPIFSKMVQNETVLDEMEKILGQNFFLYENSLLRKPKNSSNEVPWHQDFINRPDEPKKYIVWIAIDNVRVENGALKVIPGSHKLGFQKFFIVPGETHHTRLDLSGVDTSNFKYVELDAGDVLIFDQLLIHSSDRTEGSDPRRAYRFACQSFDMFYVPRCIPFVLRGGEPNQLSPELRVKTFPQPPVPKKSLRGRIFGKIKRIIKRILDL